MDKTMKKQKDLKSYLKGYKEGRRDERRFRLRKIDEFLTKRLNEINNIKEG